jgi:hypothetical protein
MKRSTVFHFLRRPAVRVLSVFAWIGLVLAFTLLPGDTALVEKTSVFLGGKDYTDANGHIVLFCILTLLCFWTLRLRFSSKKALAIAAIFGLAMGAVTELAQVFIPYRGAALLDMGADWLGVLSSVFVVTLGVLF